MDIMASDLEISMLYMLNDNNKNIREQLGESHAESRRKGSRRNWRKKMEPGSLIFARKQPIAFSTMPYHMPLNCKNTI